MLIENVSEIWSVRRSVSPWTATGGRSVGMGSERPILPHAPPSHSLLAMLSDCGTSSHQTSLSIDCGNPALTSPWNDSLSGTSTCARLNETWICVSWSETWICGIWSGTCGCENGICCHQIWNETSSQIWSGSDFVSCYCGNQTWSGIWIGSRSSCSCGFYGSCCESDDDCEI